MHVLITADTVGGVWTYTRELVSGLMPRGYRVTLVSFGKLPARSQVAWMQGLAGLDYRPTPYALEWMLNSEEDIELSKKYLEELIAEVRPDLVQFSQYAYGAIRANVPKIVVAHSDVISWWTAVRGEPPERTGWIADYCRTVSSGLSGADAVIAPSHAMLSSLRLHYLPPLRGEVIYNGRDPALFDANTRKRAQVVSVGRIWDEAKQVSLLREYNHPAPVFIVGSDQHPEHGSNYPGRESCSGITFSGPKTEEEIRTLLASSSIYAACSCYEPFGLAPLEAALSRCALIANDIPSFREVWGDAAYYFATHKADGLADAIRRLVNDRALCREYGERAYQRAASKFTRERMIDRYEQLYASLVGQEALR